MLKAESVKRSREVVVLVVMSLFLTLTGCHSGARPSVGGATSDDSQMMTVTELARLLGLSVSDTDPTHVTLKNNADTVMIFTFSGGQFYVNGKACGPVGPTDRDGGGPLVERSLLRRIKPHLSVMDSVPPHVPPPARRGLIVIDPGHGGKDPGAVSTLGYYEKEVNLAVAQYLESLLQQRGFQTILTRRSDVYVSLGERVDMANRHGADLFVSIHADSVESSAAHGYSVYTARVASRRSTQMAQAIIQDLAVGTGFFNRGLHQANYQVLIKTQCPAALVEMGYVSNPWDAQRLRDSSTQHRLAQAIASGIERFANQHRI